MRAAAYASDRKVQDYVQLCNDARQSQRDGDLDDAKIAWKQASEMKKALKSEGHYAINSIRSLIYKQKRRY